MTTNANTSTYVQVIETLKKEAATNPAADAVFHAFAARQRARKVVTIKGLYHRMKTEGFKHKDAEYASVLKLLAELGFGKLETDHKGKVKALKDVKTTLQSIGKAALGDKSAELQGFTPRNRFYPLPTQEAKAPALAKKPNNNDDFVNINLNLEGKPLYIFVPKDMTATQISEAVSKLKFPS